MIKDIFLNAIVILLVLSTVSCDGQRSRSGDKRTKKKESTTELAVKKSVKVETPEQKEESKMTPEQLAKAKELIASTEQETIDAINAKKKFKLYCTICHGIKGDLQINGAKDLTKSNISLTESVAQVYYGQGLMTPFKGILKDEEIVAVAKYTELLRR